MKAKAKAKINTAATRSATPTWEMRGPYTYGRITAIVADPENPDKVYVGAPLGGVWKSIDGGEHYEPIFDHSGGSLSIGALALDPHDSDIIYVGTGECDLPDSSSTTGDGLWKGTYDGEHWEWEHLGLEGVHRIGAIVVNPNNSLEIFVAGATGIYRTTDGGVHWDHLSPNKLHGQFRTIQMDSNNSRRLYAVSSEIWKSENSGNSWERIMYGLPTGDNNKKLVAFAIAPSSPNVLYSAYKTFHGYDEPDIDVYRSTNYGVSWFKKESITNDGNKLNDFRKLYTDKIIVSPTDENTLYLLLIGCYKSTDGGDNFTPQTGIHDDHHAMWISPNGETIYEGNDGGVYKLTDSGSTYTHQTLPIGQFYAINVDPVDHNIIFGGMQDNGSGYTSNGHDWHDNFGTGDGMIMLLDKRKMGNNQTLIYVEGQNGLIFINRLDLENHRNTGLRRIDLPHANWEAPMIMDPINNDIVYYGTLRGLYRTIRSGDTISSLEKVSPENIDFIASIDIPIAGNSNTIYLAGDRHIWVSKDKGQSWSTFSSTFPKISNHVTADPKNDAIAYVGYDGYSNFLHKTIDYGHTSTDISGNLPHYAGIHDILIDPTYSSTLYVATNFGVYISHNTGETWEPLGLNLPEIKVNDIKIVQESSEIVLYAGTYGRGIYSIRLNETQRRGAIGLRSTNVTANSAVLQWDERSTNHSTQYKIYQGNNTTPIATLPAGSTSYNITGLTENTGYVYSIKAFNSDGVSVTATATFKTSTYLPLAPSELRAINSTPTSATLNWVDNANTITGNETGYRIYDKNNLRIADLDANVTTYALTGLESNTSYTYSVKAFNANGESDPSTTTFQTPETFRKAHMISHEQGSRFTGSTLTLEWERSSIGEVYLALKGRDNHGDQINLYASDVNGTSITITDIPSKVLSINIQLRSTNPYVEHLQEENEFFNINRTNPNPPSTPSNLTNTNTTPTTATLTWSDNANNEQGFKIYKSGISTPVATVNANVSTYNLTGLTANTPYTYSVKAYNSTGESSPATVTFTTQEATTPTNPCITIQDLKHKIAQNEDVTNVNTSCITDMSRLFMNNTTFNQDISGWDVSHVTNMSTMFYGASSFNQNISGWDISSVYNNGFFSKNSALQDSYNPFE